GPPARMGPAAAGRRPAHRGRHRARRAPPGVAARGGVRGRPSPIRRLVPGAAVHVNSDHPVAQARERFALPDYYGAIHLLDEVVAAGRDFADVHHLLGLCWSLLGQEARALEAFDRALALNPRYLEAHVHRGIVLNALGRVEEGREAFAAAAASGGPPV